jgi:hypothetical protein
VAGLLDLGGGLIVGSLESSGNGLGVLVVSCDPMWQKEFNLREPRTIVGRG